MSVERVSRLDDPRLDPYRQLKDRELARDGARFIAEGEQLVRRLIASDFPVESVLVAERRLAEMHEAVPAAVPLLVVPDPTIHQVIGYKFHSGVIACGRRKPSLSLEHIVAGKSSFLLVVLPETANAENLGSLIRISAAFGVDGILLGPRCCDPFWRQSIRVSMGTVFRLPIVRSEDLAADLAQLKSRWDCQRVATVLDESANRLKDYRRPPRLALMFGNEAQGLSDDDVAQADVKLTIPMRLGTDSLNVAVAAGVFLYELTR